MLLDRIVATLAQGRMMTPSQLCETLGCGPELLDSALAHLIHIGLLKNEIPSGDRGCSGACASCPACDTASRSLAPFITLTEKGVKYHMKQESPRLD